MELVSPSLVSSSIDSQITHSATAFANAKTFGKAKMTPEAAKAAAKDFESMFIAQMTEQMMGDSLGDETFGDSDTDEIYKGLMMQEYGKQITRAGGIGIASYVERELLKLQEV